MKKAIAALASGLIVAFSLVSCAPSTPQARIQQHPQKFEALSTKHRSLVQQGLITRGMNPDAVYLAWGSPARSFKGSKKGKDTERWDYAGSRPVYGTSFYGGYGLGYGYGPGVYGPYSPYGRYGDPAFAYGIGPEVAYVPYRLASVWFISGKVDSWERAQ